jgi:hypothetical protein
LPFIRTMVLVNCWSIQTDRLHERRGNWTCLKAQAIYKTQTHTTTSQGHRLWWGKSSQR